MIDRAAERYRSPRRGRSVAFSQLRRDRRQYSCRRFPIGRKRLCDRFVLRRIRISPPTYKLREARDHRVDRVRAQMERSSGRSIRRQRHISCPKSWKIRFGSAVFRFSSFLPNGDSCHDRLCRRRRRPCWSMSTPKWCSEKNISCCDTESSSIDAKRAKCNQAPMILVRVPKEEPASTSSFEKNGVPS